MVLRRIRKGIERFLDALDSEGVALFQAVVYLHLALAGLYCLVFAGGAPTAIAAALGPVYNSVWLWLCVSPIICLAGKLLSHKVSSVWAFTSGLYLQLAGDIGAAGAFGGYVVSTFQENPWGKAMVAVFIFQSLAWCALLLCWRDIRRIRQAERAVRS